MKIAKLFGYCPKVALLCLFVFSLSVPTSAKILNLSDLGLQPDTKEDATPYLIKAMQLCKVHNYKVLNIPEGRYDFYPCENQKMQVHISAHDHQESRYVGISLQDIQSLVIDGNGSDFVFHGNMLPFALIDCENISLRNFSIDFETPHYAQALITRVTSEFCDIEVDHSYVVRNDRLYLGTEIGDMEMDLFMVFDKEGKFILPGTGDLAKYSKAERLDSATVRLYGMTDRFLHRGDVLFMRNGFRPNPGIFSWRCRNMSFDDIDIYWAQGMGMLSQRCENMDMNRVNVRIRPGGDRYFTTVDALHFTACKGKISVRNGVYENMMDDALNVHGDYLQVQRIDSGRKKIVIAYKHFQSFGYEAAAAGETVQFVSRQTMLPLGKMRVQKASRLNDYEVELTFQSPVSQNIGIGDCVENVSWCPKIAYKNNVIRNNRARGVLVSSPYATVIRNNLFENCSGSAILLSSDCNSWFLSGACHDLTIKNNRFYHCMTSYYQYCDGIISIYPEMPSLAKEKYHSNIRIANNDFKMYMGQCVLFAKSVDGLSFVKNQIEYTDKHQQLQSAGASTYRIIMCDRVNLLEK